MQMHHQYQVILKPDPGNPQELYLASLEAIGLDRTRHDIRFVEDNWESPALGAWGLGWEVWLDGQEITQFTYFQQAGSLTLDPVSVEITYGLDRIVMYLQHKTQVWDIDVDGVHTFAELYKDPEVEHCVYDFEVADVERLKRLYEIYKAEAAACIARGLAIPAHDYVLRQSHTFNLLDARGAIGVTERAKFFADMRGQAKAVSELYVAQRERLEFPWLKEPAAKTPPRQSPNLPISQSPNLQSPISNPSSSNSAPKNCRRRMSSTASPRSRRNWPRCWRATSSATAACASPARRGAWSPTSPTWRRCRPTSWWRSAARRWRRPTTLGQPTKALEGFARGQGVAVAALEQRDNYVYAVKRVAGKPAAEVLPALCLDLLHQPALGQGHALEQQRHRLLAPAALDHGALRRAGRALHLGRREQRAHVSRGPRFADAAAQLPPGGFTTFAVADAQSYFDAVAAAGVVVDRTERRQLVAELVAAAAASVGGVTPDDPGLLDEVTDLVEAPQALLGSFEARHLELPAPVLIGVMKKHQRYFPVIKEGKLLNYFVAVANSNDLAHPDVVREGYEGVIRARYADAAYFYRHDTAAAGELLPAAGHAHLPRQTGLDAGPRAAAQRSWRRRWRACWAHRTAEIATVARAAELSKADLMTSMVVEMTSLQGIMGEIYAIKSGETPAVGQAIREQYLPRSAGDDAPASLPGLALALADKLDSLIGLFAVRHPHRQRRSLRAAPRRAGRRQQPDRHRDPLQRARRAGRGGRAPAGPRERRGAAGDGHLCERRLEGVLGDLGFAHDVVEAVLAVRGDDPVAAVAACRALAAAVAQPAWGETFTAYARTARITRQLDRAARPQPGGLRRSRGTAVARRLRDGCRSHERSRRAG
jgi:glycyl-tRNA synthetase